MRYNSLAEYIVDTKISPWKLCCLKETLVKADCNSQAGFRGMVYNLNIYIYVFSLKSFSQYGFSRKSKEIKQPTNQQQSQNKKAYSAVW